MMLNETLNERWANFRRRNLLWFFAPVFTIFVIALPSQSIAQMGPDYWQVTGVAADDHLNVRSGPGANNRIIATAPNGFTFRNLGCRGTGNSRWCHVETTDGHTSGWVAGRFLREGGGPGAAAAPASDVPELHARNTGEIEVGFARGCTVLYNPLGTRIAAGSSCSRAQLNHAHDAVEAYLRENAPGADHGGGGSAHWLTSTSEALARFMAATT